MLSRISTPTRVQAPRWPQVYLGVSLTTLATLILELSLTRIFSVIFYYHFAFLAISIAMFGLGAGGLFSYVVIGWRGNLFKKLGSLAALNSLAVVLSLVFMLSREGKLSSWTLALVYFSCAVPFFLSGTVVSLVISETLERVNRVYFYDLLGAGVGCLLLVPFLNHIGGPNTVIAAGTFFAVSAAIWYNLAGSLRGRAVSVAFALAFVALVIYNAKHGLIDVRYAKGESLKNEQFVKWNGFSRVAVTPDSKTGQLSIIVDGDAAVGIPDFDLDNLSEKDRHDLLGQGPGFPYLLRPAAKALIIGPGGGWDICRALASGSQSVTGVEINPIIANTIMQERFPHYSRDLYARPEVRIVVEEGRSFVRRSTEKFQVLQATLLDTWTSTAAGAMSLSESSLYTTDAFRDYFDRLTEDGILAFTRWGLRPPSESLRLVSLAVEALSQAGENEPSRHVIVIREKVAQGLNTRGAKDTVIIARKPFSAEDLSLARASIQQNGLQTVYIPGSPNTGVFAELLQSRNREEYSRQYSYNISPVDDNSPFFFYNVQPRDLWRFVSGTSPPNTDYVMNRAVPLLFGLMAVSLLATGVILALPPLLLKSRLPRDKSVLKFLWYFIFLGSGYILIQVALIQKFVLFLGHPTYALTVVIFSMMIFSGVGSYLSPRFVGHSEFRLKGVLAIVALLALALAALVPPLSEEGVGWPFLAKVGISILLIAPAGFVMGMPFPTGLSMLELRHKGSIRWAWSLNSASSVLGSAGAILLAIYIGLKETLLVGGALYLCALAVVRLTRRPVLETTVGKVART